VRFDELTRLRRYALFYWIAKNIEYDETKGTSGINALKSTDPNSELDFKQLSQLRKSNPDAGTMGQSTKLAEQTLCTKQGVCRKHADLFLDLLGESDEIIGPKETGSGESQILFSADPLSGVSTGAQKHLLPLALPKDDTLMNKSKELTTRKHRWTALILQGTAYENKKPKKLVDVVFARTKSVETNDDGVTKRVERNYNPRSFTMSNYPEFLSRHCPQGDDEAQIATRFYPETLRNLSYADWRQYPRMPDSAKSCHCISMDDLAPSTYFLLPNQGQLPDILKFKAKPACTHWVLPAKRAFGICIVPRSGKSEVPAAATPEFFQNKGSVQVMVRKPDAWELDIKQDSLPKEIAWVYLVGLDLNDDKSWKIHTSIKPDDINPGLIMWKLASAPLDKPPIVEAKASGAKETVSRSSSQSSTQSRRRGGSQ